MTKTIRIKIDKTGRTDLVCIHCGRFMTEYVVLSPGASEVDAHVGVHRKCVDLVKAKRGG